MIKKTFWEPHVSFIVMLGIFIASALWLALRLPAFSTPNEILHYEYVAILLNTREMPDPSTSQRMDERHQPPMYYSLVALAGLPFSPPLMDTQLTKNPDHFGTPTGNRNPFLHATLRTVPVLYVGRFVSLLLAAAAVTVLYVTANISFGRPTASLIASIMAFQPMFLFLSVSLSNDMALVFMTTCLLAHTTYLIRGYRSDRAYFLWGILFAVAMLTKSSAAFLAVLLIFPLLMRWRQSGRVEAVLRAGLLSVLGFIPVYSLWAIYNRFRGLDMLALERSFPLNQVLALRPSDFAILRPYIFRLWKSFWLDWSAGETGYTAALVYVIAAIFLFIALAGWLRTRQDSPRPWLLAVMHILWPLPLVILFGGVKTLMVKGAGFLVAEGRWILPALPSLAWLAGAGWARWWSASRRSTMVQFTVLVPVISTILMMLIIIPAINPAARRLSKNEDIPDSATRVQVVYGDEIEMLAIGKDEFVMDTEIYIDMYWQALTDVERDYRIWSRLILPSSDNWALFSLQETYHGSGLSPSKGWKKGEIYHDAIGFTPAMNLYGPSVALLQVELYDGNERLPVMRDGQPIDEGIVHRVVLRPENPLRPEDQAQLAVPIQFGDLFELTGLETDVIENKVTLLWRALAETETDYTVFVHLIDENGELVAQSDQIPNDGLSPTNIWQPDDVIRDIHSLPIDLSSGTALHIGAYDLQTLHRLPATQDGILLPDNVFRFELPSLQVKIANRQ